MKVLFSYTLNTIKENKRTSLSIMAAVLLASTLLCALCTYGYTELGWRIEIEEYESGQWHAELGGEIFSDKLDIVDNNLYVDRTMVKGPFSCLELPEGSALPYLLMRDADQNYWELMGEKNAVLEGRVPKAPGEIVVSKSFFDRNPGYHLGDTITLPIGERRLGEELLDETRVRQAGEVFDRTGEVSVTLVGKLDATTNTSIPGYYAMGYLDRSSLGGDEELVIYVRLKDVRKTYEIMPQIADAVGVEKNEYGKYDNHFRYHAILLALNFVFPPGIEFSIGNWGVPIIYGILLLLAMGCFVMIINGAFQVSARARMRQLGMFRSVGATPMQIAGSVLLEGVVLSAVPVLLSIGIGYLFTETVMGIYSDLAGELLYFPVTVRFPPRVALFSAAVSLLTVLISAALPAWRIARLSPLEAIRMQESGGAERGKRSRPCAFSGRFGTLGELAGAAHYANRKAFRAGVASLTLCLMLVTGFFILMRLNDFLSERNVKARYYNIIGRLDHVAEADRDLLSDILSVPGEQDGAYFCVTRMALWVSGQEETAEFRDRGGFAGLDLNKWAIAQSNGRYRIRAYLYGLQEEKFDEFCRLLGADPAKYYNTDNIRAVAHSAAPLYPDAVNNEQKANLSYSHLQLSAGQELTLEEKTEDRMSTDKTIRLEIGAVAQEGPILDDERNNYTVNLYMPLSVYYSAISGLDQERAGNYNVELKVKTQPQDDLAVTDRITRLCESAMAEEDFFVISTEQEKKNNAAGMRAMGMVINCIGFLMGLIGVSNTLSAVSHSMMRRRREFAMLRCVGMDNQGVEKLLALEAIRMALTPVMIALPAVFAMLQLLMILLDVSWREMASWLPWGKLFVSILAVMAAVAVSYLACAGRIRRDTIIEAVREENV